MVDKEEFDVSFIHEMLDDLHRLYSGRHVVSEHLIGDAIGNKVNKNYVEYSFQFRKTELYYYVNRLCTLAVEKINANPHLWGSYTRDKVAIVEYCLNRISDKEQELDLECVCR